MKVRKVVLCVFLGVIVLFQQGCSTAEQIGLGLGRTLQAAGQDTVKIVQAVSTKDGSVP